MFWLTRSTNLIITRARRWGLKAAQSFCASTAVATAASTSADEAITTCAWTSPVLGLRTSAVRVDVPAVRCPSMKCGICVVMSVPLEGSWRILGHPSNSVAWLARSSATPDAACVAQPGHRDAQPARL